jgi:hypothetical protein
VEPAHVHRYRNYSRSENMKQFKVEEMNCRKLTLNVPNSWKNWQHKCCGCFTVWWTMCRSKACEWHYRFEDNWESLKDNSQLTVCNVRVLNILSELITIQSSPCWKACICSSTQIPRGQCNLKGTGACHHSHSHSHHQPLFL